MKNNAITRIVLWSIVIVVLLGIMCCLMFGTPWSRRSGATESALVTAPDETMVSGWSATVDDAKYSVSTDVVQKISIEWVSGDILIQPGDVEEITFHEDNVNDEKYALVWKCRNNELDIRFCAENVSSFFGINTVTLSKDLTIVVPRDWVCDSLEVDAASATLEVNDMTIREVDLDTASGTCEFENCTVDEIDIDTASGDIRFIGSLDTLSCDAASASVYAVLSNIPSRLDIDTMSGDLDITIPEDAGFTITMDTMSSEFSSDFDTTVKNGKQVCGDGRCRINISAMSGDVAIRKGESDAVSTIPDAPIAPEAPTAPDAPTAP